MKKLTGLLLLLAAFGARADYLGDFAPATTAICGYYTTYNPSTGAPFTLAGSPVISVYKTGDGTNSATESTTGVTHAEDFDSRTGYNRVCVDTSADGTFYSAGAQFSVAITAGTVNSVSVVGSEVKSFSLNKVAALRPTTAGRTVVVDASGLADANAVKLGPTGSGTAQTARDLGASVLLSPGTGTGQISLASGATTVGTVSTGAISEASYATTAGSFSPLGIVDQGTAQAATSTTLQLRSADTFADSELNGAYVFITGGTTGVGQVAQITSYTGSTDTATVPTWTTTPTGAITYKVIAYPKNVLANAVQVGTQTASASGTVTFPNATLASTTNITASAGAVLSSTGINNILDAVLSGHTTGGTVGGALNSASSAGDPWNTALPGAYASGTAGNIIGNRIDAAVTTRLAPATAGRTLVVDAAGLADANVVKLGPTGSGTAQTARDIGASVIVGTNNDKTGYTVSTVSDKTGYSIGSNGITNASFDTTAGPMYAQGIIDQGTAQGGSATTIQLRSAANFTADSSIIGATVLITGGTGVGQSRTFTAYTNSTDTGTVATWTTNPDSTSTYKVYGTAPGSASSLDATAVENAVWNSTRAGHTTAGTFGEYTPANITTIGGSALSTSTAQLGVNVVNFGGAAGTFASGRPETNLARIAGQTVTASGGVTFPAATLASTTNITTATGVTVSTNSDKTGYTVSTVSDKSGYSLSSAGINAIADQSTTGHTTAGTWGGAWNAAGSSGDPWATALPGGYGAGSAGNIIGNNLNGTITSRMATFTLPTNFSATAITVGGAVTVGTNGDKTGYTASTVSDKTGYSLTVTPPTAAVISTQVLADQGILIGTCSSGSTTTCVDAGRTEANASQIQEHIIQFSDGFSALVTTFNAGTDTMTTTKVAPATRASLTYKIYPATAQ